MTEAVSQKLQWLADNAIAVKNNITYNATKTFALCQQIPNKDHAAKRYRFIVIRLNDQQVVHENAFSMGYVKWVGSELILSLLEFSLRLGRW